MTEWLWFFGKIVGAIGIMMSIAPVFTMVERRVAAFIQGRVGPNRVGPLGLLQAIADLLKFITKEQIIPERADRFLYVIAPLICFAPPMIGFGVVPYGAPLWGQKFQVLDLNIGVLFIMAVISTGVYGLALGGWSSNNKYSLMGSLRASAQIISYELSLGLAILVGVMMSESVDLNVIVMKQAEGGLLGWNIFGGGTLWAMPFGVLGFIVMYITSLAENNRLPFDLSECEAELVSGYHTEYSSMNLGIFMLSEYLAQILLGGLMASLFLGGWHFPLLIDPHGDNIVNTGLSIAVFMGKIASMLFFNQWLRWTLPRFRYDQLMNIGWKALLPISILNVAAVAVVGVFLEG